ncbi:MAG: CPBP family intramembrane metalloprotease [Lachnospiraceae bacterium]|nr:CPBP family intramembrane metalloprotease [Lachnospiraceae bacterium]
MNNQKNRKDPIKIYLGLIFFICYGLGFLEFVTGTGKIYHFLGIAFTFLPVLTAFLTRRITGAPGKIRLSLKVWKHPKSWLFSALVPGILIVLGTVLYFIVFPHEYSGVFRYGMRLGTNAEITIKSPFVLALACIVIAAVLIPIQLLELGEEIGWRGYLLGFQIERYGLRKAVLINGVEWGLTHLPLIYFGFNYSLNNPGAPYTNMALMLLVCVVTGILFSYITIQTGNCMYAAIMHGVVNVIGELPVYMTHSMESGLLGPNPTGILSISVLAAFSILLMAKMKDAPDN